jgi:polyhydroxyalkanoate synthesis repressor PhaR
VVASERIIKKYPNRRLYDTAVSRYVSLADIRQLVVDGVRFRVVDARTEDDLTRSILLQIIVEQEEKGQPILSTELLEKLIRFYGDALQVFMSSYLDKSVELFAEHQTHLQEQMASLLVRAPVSALAEMAQRNLDLWRKAQEETLQTFGWPAGGRSEPQPRDDKERG